MNERNGLKDKAQEVARDCDKGLCRQGKDFRFSSWRNEETLKDREQKNEMFCFTLNITLAGVSRTVRVWGKQVKRQVQWLSWLVPMRL